MPCGSRQHVHGVNLNSRNPTMPKEERAKIKRKVIKNKASITPTNTPQLVVTFDNWSL